MSASSFERDLRAGVIDEAARPVGKPKRAVSDRRIYERIPSVTPSRVFQAGAAIAYRNETLREARDARVFSSPDIVGLKVKHAREWHHRMLRELGMLPKAGA